MRICSGPLLSLSRCVRITHIFSPIKIRTFSWNWILHRCERGGVGGRGLDGGMGLIIFWLHASVSSMLYVRTTNWSDPAPTNPVGMFGLCCEPGWTLFLFASFIPKSRLRFNQYRRTGMRICNGHRTECGPVMAFLSHPLCENCTTLSMMTKLWRFISEYFAVPGGNAVMFACVCACAHGYFFSFAAYYVSLKIPEKFIASPLRAHFYYRTKKK